MTDSSRVTQVTIPGQANDTLSGEVAIRANMDQTGLTVAGKSRALAAADRLFGGLLGIPAEYLDGIRARMNAKNRISEEKIIVEGRSSIADLDRRAQVESVAMQRLAAEETRNQINREAVWIETEEALKAAPPPQPGSPENDVQELDEDWINVFAGYAEKASSDHLRQLWGRILAGEIRKPASYARSTLRVISEMDIEIATTFQEVAKLRLFEDCIVRPIPLRGQQLLNWIFLEEVGLLQEASSGLSRTFEGNGGDDFFVAQNNYYLRLVLRDRKQKFGVFVTRLTRAGREIANILPTDDLSALKSFAENTPIDAGVEIGKIVSFGADGTFKGYPIEVMRQFPKERI
ncbi:MAG: DUF2806 domain-containing protein [Rhodopila sp.]|nr:DUF2806 domain-containing protein [Rhodopila sp.]